MEALRRDKRGLQAMLKNWKKNLLWLLMAVSLMLCACGQVEIVIGDGSGYDSSTQNGSQLSGAGNRSQTSVSLDSIPEYSGDPYVVVNNNVPFFSEEDLEAEVFESYGDLDSLGRCTVAYSMVGTETMPTQERGNIGQVKPTGWHAVKYDNVDGKYLYNRCHLIGYQLTAENANVNNLITGTRYLNVQGMLPFENLTADYIKETGNHVLYRVTPVFEGDNLVASGVLMEGESVEDDGEAIQFCVYVYNVQPGIIIDNRLEVSGEGRGSLYECDPTPYHGDFISPEQIIPPEGICDKEGNPMVWEACFTMNNNWGYCANDHYYKPASMLIKKLVECVSKGGNMILNVGPDAKGKFPKESSAILSEIGRWMDKNHDSIYGCAPAADIPKPDYGRITRNGNKYYVHIYENTLGPLPLIGFDKNKIVKVRALDDGHEVPISTLWVHSDYPDIAFVDLGPDPVLPDPVDYVLEVEMAE